jgi:hypothetical protein
MLCGPPGLFAVPPRLLAQQACLLPSHGLLQVLPQLDSWPHLHFSLLHLCCSERGPRRPIYSGVTRTTLHP